MKLLDYHRLRRAEVVSWDRERLKEEAIRNDPEFLPELERLWLTEGKKYAPDMLVNVPRDEAFERISRICELYRDGMESRRVYIRSRVNQQCTFRFEGFGLRAAVIAAREHSLEMMRLALIAFAITDLECSDAREILMSAPILFHSARLAGGDALVLFDEAAHLSGPGMAALFRDFARRHPDLQTLACMGWYQVETPDGIGFTRTPPQKI
jgi:hypothetical protein